MAQNYKTYVEKYPSGYSIRVTFGKENRLINVSQDTMSNKTKAVTYAKNLAKQNKGVYAGFKEMGQLSLFSNTKKKNTMAKKETAAVKAAKVRVKKASEELKGAKAKIKKIEVKVIKAKRILQKDLAAKQRGSSNTAKDKKRVAKAPGKRISAKGAKNQYGTSKGGNVYYEWRKNRSDVSKARKI